jgi:hypothetical protein
MQHRAWPTKFDGILHEGIEDDRKYDDPTFYSEYWDDWEEERRKWGLGTIINPPTKAEICDAVFYHHMRGGLMQQVLNQMAKKKGIQPPRVVTPSTSSRNCAGSSHLKQIRERERADNQHARSSALSCSRHVCLRVFVGYTTRCTPMVFSAFEATPFLRFSTNIVRSARLFLLRCRSLIGLNCFPFLKRITVWEIDTQLWHRSLPPASATVLFRVGA